MRLHTTTNPVGFWDGSASEPEVETAVEDAGDGGTAMPTGPEAGNGDAGSWPVYATLQQTD